MIKFVKDYIHELKVLHRQLDHKDLKQGAIIGLVITIGIPILGVLAIINLFT